MILTYELRKMIMTYYEKNLQFIIFFFSYLIAVQ